ncbi:MAG: cytochrome b N-terminal domain-containing protein [Acidobacteriota bacterium]
MSSSPRIWMRVYDWLDDRAGLRPLVRRALDEPITGGARWAYVFGSALVFLFALQALTGILLALYYVPSADHAHASVAYIQKAVSGGWLIRGLHHYSAHAMVILILAHISQTFLFGAYKGRRELVWMAGVILLLLILGFAFTGYLLPWDQAAYFGTRVGTSVAGEAPLIGPLQQRIMLGGSEISSLTLSRFFLTHAFALPLATTAMIAGHIYLFRRAGAAGPFDSRGADEKTLFYPNQVLKDSIAVLILFLALVALSWMEPAALGPQADPTSDYLARPPWFFLPLFQLLKYFPGRLSLIPTLVLPALLLGALFLLPFVDRRSERHPLKRRVATTSFAIIFVVAGLFIGLSKYEDMSAPDVRAKMEQQAKEADDFLRLPFQPQEVGRSIAVSATDGAHPSASGSKPLQIFFANCANCHGADATGGAAGISLINLARNRRHTADSLAEWIEGHRREPSPDSMPRYRQLDPSHRRELAEWLIGLERPIEVDSSARGEILDGDPPSAYTESCAICHGDRGEGNIGPPLVGVTSKPGRAPDDLLRMMDDSRVYGLKDPMPESFPQISESDRRRIIEWIEKLRRK